MNRFNLEFNGEILPGRDPERTRERFGELMGIEDSARLDQCFSGDTVILLSNLDRKAAAEYYSSLRKIGVVSQLVKMTTLQAAAAVSPLDDFAGSTKQKREKARRAAKQAQAQREASEKTNKHQADDKAASPQAKKQPRRKEKLAARKKTEREQAAQQAAEWQRIADQKAARELEELEAAVRQAAEEKRREEEAAARQKARQEEAERKAALEQLKREEQAKQEAAAEKRRQDEETARLKAQRKEAERKAAEEKRQREEQAKREAAAEKRRQTEEAARLKAQRKEAERKAAEEKRQREEQARREAAEQQQREAEAAKRQAAEEKRLKAEQAAKRKAAQDQARQKAAKEKRRKAEEAARIKGQKKETDRKAAQEKRQREQQARLEVAEKKRLQADAAKQRAAEAKQQKAERAAKQKSERDESRRQAVQLKRHQAEQEKAQRKAMDEAAIGRAAQELTRQPSLKPVEARVKTRLEIPKTAAGTSHPAGQSNSVKSGQPGAANFFALRPFRNTPEVQSRAAQAGERARRFMTLAGLALAILLALGGFRLNSPPPQQISAAQAMTVTPGSGPLLLAADQLLFHDRAGVALGSVELGSMGLSELTGPLQFTAAGELLAQGRIATTQQDNDTTVLLRCKLLQRQCEPAFQGEATPPTDAFAVHPISGALLSASTVQGRLFMTGVDGELLAEIDAPIAESPIMRLDAGLLLMNSASGSAISVMRYDDRAFGQQLDEILLLPPPAIEEGQTQLRDFVKVAQTWWVILQAPANGVAGIYRFDERWNYLSQAETPAGSLPIELASWGEKVLVRYQARAAISRFNADGDTEADFSPDQLDSLIEEQRQSATLQALAWRWGTSALALAALCWLALAGLNHTRKLVYRSHPEHGARPVDELAGEIRWVAPVPERYGRIRRTVRFYCAVAVLCLCGAIAAGVNVTQLTALLLALSGPALALWLLLRSPVGHLGIVDEQLLLADHTGMYHFGGNARLHYRGRFLLIDDVLLFTGNALFPAFNPGQVTDEVMPLAHKGIRVDRKTVLVKLLQQRHPLATGACVIASGLALAAALLVAPLL